MKYTITTTGGVKLTLTIDTIKKLADDRIKLHAGQDSSRPLVDTEMTDEEILKKAIEKAAKNDFDIYDGGGDELEKVHKVYLKHHAVEIHAKPFDIEGDLYGLIFSHAFAKAFWGEKKRPGVIGLPHQILKDEMEGKSAEGNLYKAIIKREYVPEWQYHLQQMVLEENPLKYLEKFL